MPYAVKVLADLVQTGHQRKSARNLVLVNAAIEGIDDYE